MSKTNYDERCEKCPLWKSLMCKMDKSMKVILDDSDRDTNL